MEGRRTNSETQINQTTYLIDESRRSILLTFQEDAKIRFRNIEFLNLSFIHRSVINENIYANCNERLEFLGDSVLGVIASTLLYNLPNRKNEGELAKIKSVIVSEESLAALAIQLKISDLIVLGKGEEHSGGRQKNAILADALEALIGSYYLDSGFDQVFKFVENLLTPIIQQVLEDRYQKDYKTLLQELSQRLYRSYPQYRFIKKFGPDHDRTFWMEVLVQNVVYGVGQGKNKKAAEQRAAEEAYLFIISRL